MNVKVDKIILVAVATVLVAFVVGSDCFPFGRKKQAQQAAYPAGAPTYGGAPHNVGYQHQPNQYHPEPAYTVPYSAPAPNHPGYSVGPNHAAHPMGHVTAPTYHHPHHYNQPHHYNTHHYGEPHVNHHEGAAHQHGHMSNYRYPHESEHQPRVHNHGGATAAASASATAASF